MNYLSFQQPHNTRSRNWRILIDIFGVKVTLCLPECVGTAGWTSARSKYKMFKSIVFIWKLGKITSVWNAVYVNIYIFVYIQPYRLSQNHCLTIFQRWWLGEESVQKNNCQINEVKKKSNQAVPKDERMSEANLFWLYPLPDKVINRLASSL